MEQAIATEVPSPKAPKVRKARKPRRKRAAPAPKVADPATIGLTPDKCPAGCTEHRCVISERGYCAHPFKGGLHAADMLNPAAVARAQKAKKTIDHMAVEKR